MFKRRVDLFLQPPAASAGPRPGPLSASRRAGRLACLAVALLSGLLSASGMFVQEQKKAHNGAFRTALSQGREFDSHAGHYFFRNRIYFPEWGAFATPDMNMALGPLSEPMGIGSCGAFANHPLGKRDPTGKAWLPPEQLLPYREIPGAVKQYAESGRFDVNGDGVVDARDEDDFLRNPSAGFESGDPSTAFMALDRVIRDPMQAEEHTKIIQDAREWLTNPDNARYLAQRNEGLYQSAVALSLFSVRFPFTPRTGALPGTWLARSRLVMGAGDPGLGFMVTRLAAKSELAVTSASRQLISQSQREILIGTVENGEVKLFKTAAGQIEGHSDLVKQGLVSPGAQGFNVSVENGQITALGRNSSLNPASASYNLPTTTAEQILEQLGAKGATIRGNP